MNKFQKKNTCHWAHAFELQIHPFESDIFSRLKFNNSILSIEDIFSVITDLLI